MDTRNKHSKAIEAFATTMRITRQRAEISQEELAHRAGLSMSFVSLLETGKRQPTISTIVALCAALEISMSEFMREVEERL